MKKQIKVQLDKNDIRQIENAISNLESNPDATGSKIFGGSYCISRFHPEHSDGVDAVSAAAATLGTTGVQKEEEPTFSIVINEKDEVIESDYEEFPIADFIKDLWNDISLFPFYVNVVTKDGNQEITVSRSPFASSRLHYAFRSAGREIASINICRRAGGESRTIFDSRKKAKDLGYDGVFTHAQYSALGILEAFLNKSVAKKNSPLFKDLGLESGSPWEWFDGVYVKGSSLFVSSDESADPKPEKVLINAVKTNYDCCSFRADEDGLLVPDKKGDKVSVLLPANDPGVVTHAGGSGGDYYGFAGVSFWGCNYWWDYGDWHIGLRPFKVCFKEEK